MWMGSDGVGILMLIAGIWMTVFWGVIIALVVWGIAKISNSRPGSKDRLELPLQTAQRRLASGDMTLDEFNEIRQAIG